MISPTSARAALRAATAPSHERVDALFGKLRLDQPGPYGQFLAAQAAAYIPVEEALTQAGAAEIVPDWIQRQRAALLRADLTDLGIAPPAPVAVPIFASPSAILGGVYVLEGSRLGGAMLKKAVPPDLPTRFMGGGSSAAWRDLLAILDERLTNEAERLISIKAAIEVFSIFERGGELFLKTE
jgi:heme oxygenase